MLELLESQPPSVFWQVFASEWNLCDNTWNCQSELVSQLRSNNLRGRQFRWFRAADRRFWYELPDPVMVYRGCSRERIEGVAWTIDQAVAEHFARGHRQIPVPEPVVASALIERQHIFAVRTERDEREIILDPFGLVDLRYHHNALQAGEGEGAMEFNDTYTCALGLSYAIAALEQLPKDRQEREELDALWEMLGRVMPDSGFRDQYVHVARNVLAGEGRPFDRPKLV